MYDSMCRFVISRIYFTPLGAKATQAVKLVAIEMASSGYTRLVTKARTPDTKLT